MDREVNQIKSFLQNRPTLSMILSTYGSMPLLDYIDCIYKKHQKKLDSKKKEELYTVLNNLSQKILNKPYPISSDLLVTGITSTADHHGILTHPFFLGANSARAYCLHTKYSIDTVTTLSCAGVSLSNNSYPRGYIYTDINGEQCTLPLISLKNKNIPVYTAPPFTKQSLQKILDSIYLAKVSNQDKTKVIFFLKKLRDDAHLYTLDDFDMQVSYINYLFFKHIDIHQNTDLFYFSQESIVRELLLKYHLDQNTLLSEFLCHKRYHELFKIHFKGLVGAFDDTHHTGTDLFWGIHDSKRIALHLVDGYLVSDDKKIHIKLIAKELKEALYFKKIMPSMALTFIVLSFYYGVTCGGGYSQVDYLGPLQQAWASLLKDTQQEPAELLDVPTSVYLGDFAFIKNKFGLGYGFDLFYEDIKSQFSINLLEAHTLLIPFFLKIHK